jgi:hypothetical protein
VHLIRAVSDAQRASCGKEVAQHHILAHTSATMDLQMMCRSERDN